MEAFVEQLSSPSWWIGVVIVGIIINLVAAYIKPKIDNWLSGVSVYWSEKNQRDNEEKKKEIERLRNNKEEQFLVATDDLRQRIRAIHFLLLGVFFMMLPSLLDLGAVSKPFALGIAGFTYFYSFLIFQGAARINSLLHEVRKKDSDQPA